MSHVRRYGAALAFVLIFLGLAGCNAKGTNLSDVAGGGNAPAALTENQFAPALLAAQAAAGSAHVDASIKAAGQSAKLSGDVTGLNHVRDAAMRMSLRSNGQQLQLIALQQTVYLKGVGFGTSSGKPWLKVDLSKSHNPMSQLLTSANPAKYMAYLKGITTFHDRGLQTVDGVQTRHYTVTVDTAKMLKNNPAFHGQTMSGMGLPRELTSQVYVDAQNRPISMTIRMGSVASVSAHFSRYGEPVHVSAPPASQVSTFSL
jgi:hypothetical protein